MANGNLRIFGGSPRPFSQVGTDERKNPGHGLYRPNFPCRRIFRPGADTLARAPGWSGAGLPAGFESAGSLPRESAATPFWHFWHLPETATLPRTPAIGAECSGSATGGLRFAAGSALRKRQPHREGGRAAPNHPHHGRAPGRPEVIAADEVAAEGLAHARTLKMTSSIRPKRARDTQDAALGGAQYEHPAIRSAASYRSPGTADGRRFQGAKGCLNPCSSPVRTGSEDRTTRHPTLDHPPA